MGFCLGFSLVWFVYAARRGEERRGGGRRPLDGSEAAGSGVVVVLRYWALAGKGLEKNGNDRYALSLLLQFKVASELMGGPTALSLCLFIGLFWRKIGVDMFLFPKLGPM